VHDGHDVSELSLEHRVEVGRGGEGREAVALIVSNVSRLKLR
jgi:hypothetical protein